MSTPDDTPCDCCACRLRGAIRAHFAATGGRAEGQALADACDAIGYVTAELVDLTRHPGWVAARIGIAMQARRDQLAQARATSDQGLH